MESVAPFTLIPILPVDVYFKVITHTYQTEVAYNNMTKGLAFKTL